MAEKGSDFGLKTKNEKRVKPAKKNATVYARFLSRYKWYCPNSFRPIDSAFAFLVSTLAFIALPYMLVPIVKAGGDFMSAGQIYCLSAVLSQAVILAVAVVFCKARKVPLFSGGGFCFKFDFGAILPAVLLTLATAILIAPAHNEFSEILTELRKLLGGGTSGGNEIVVDISNFNDLAALFFVYVVVIPVFPAICEEALFRGVIARGLKGYGDFSAAILSGFLFAIMHGNYSQFLLQFVLGVEIGYVVLKTGNFALGSIMHFTNNAYALISALLVASGYIVSTELALVIQAAAMLFGTACLFLSIYLWARYYKKRRGKRIKTVDDSKCCLKRDGSSDATAFVVEEGVIKTSALRKSNGLENCLYFYNGRFVRFNECADKRKSVAITVCVFVVSILISVACIAVDFFA